MSAGSPENHNKAEMIAAMAFDSAADDDSDPDEDEDDDDSEDLSGDETPINKKGKG